MKNAVCVRCVPMTTNYGSFGNSITNTPQLKRIAPPGATPFFFADFSPIKGGYWEPGMDNHVLSELVEVDTLGQIKPQKLDPLDYAKKVGI